MAESGGLLDFIRTPEGQGLLSAAFGGLAGARQGAPLNSIGRAGMAGLMGYGNAQDRQQQAAEAAQTGKYRDMQQQSMQMQIEEAKRKREREEKISAGVGKFFIPGQAAVSAGADTPIGSAIGNPNLFSTSASNAVNQGSRSIPATAPSIDTNGLGAFLAENGDYEKAISMMPKSAKYSTEVRYDQNGNAFMTAEDGSMKPLAGIRARDKLTEVRLGDKVGFRSEYSPEISGSLPIGQSADSKASNALGWANNAATLRGQNMTDGRARDLNDINRGEKKKVEDLTKGGQIASFDTMLGTLERLGKHDGLSRSVGLVGAFPTMPGSESANFKAELDTFQSQAFIPMVSQLKGMGALSDAEGKKLTAAVGALNPNMGEKAFRDSISRITNEMESARSRVSGKPRPDQKEPTDQAKPSKPPMLGQVVDGHKFKGGNPADSANWEKQ